MSFEFKVDDIIPIRQTTDETNIQILKRVRDRACELYQQQPARFQPDDGIVAGAIQTARDMMDGLCRDKPLPPVPSSPFSGGQCECVSYFYDLTFSIDGTSPTTGRQGATAPIVGLIYAPTTLSTFPGALDVSVRATTCVNGKPTGYSDSYKGTIRPGGFASISNVRRQDNAPDTCGNPERRHTPNPFKPAINFNADIDLNGRLEVRPVIIFAPIVLSPKLEFNPRFNVTIPIKIGEVNFDFSGNKITQRNYQVNENTEINNQINLVKTDIANSITTINNNTNSQNNTTRTNLTTNQTNNTNTINTNIGNAQTTINNNTNLQTTTIRNEINSNTNTQVSNSATSINSNTSNSINAAVVNINGNINAASLNLSAEIRGVLAANLLLIRADIEAVFRLALEINNKPDCPELPPPPSELEEEPVPPDENNRTKARLKLVVIVLTKEPNKQQPGGGNGAPTKQIAGWFSWKVEGNAYTSLEPINYGRSAFWVPQTPVIGYAYTLTNFAQGFAVEYTVPVA